MGLPKDLRRIKLMEKQRQALQMRRVGMSYDAIATSMALSARANARRLVQAAIADIPREEAEEVKQLELLRLDSLSTRLQPAILAGDPKAIAAELSIMDRRARYLGLDAPRLNNTKLEVAGTTHAELSAKITRLITGLDETEDPEESDD